MKHDHDARRSSSHSTPPGTTGASPGKAALLQAGPVQRKARPGSSGAAVPTTPWPTAPAAAGDDVQAPPLAATADDPFGFHLVGTRAVQRHGAGSAGGDTVGADPHGVHDIAARATAGSGGALPHLDTVQRAFGPHDVTGVRAHTDGDAADGARRLGARAFACRRCPTPRACARSAPS